VADMRVLVAEDEQAAIALLQQDLVFAHHACADGEADGGDGGLLHRTVGFHQDNDVRGR
jgi:hypothetical protein